MDTPTVSSAGSSVSAKPVATPTTPTTATTAQVAAHHTFVQTAIADLEKLPQTVENAEKYLALKEEEGLAWVQAANVNTRIIEVVALSGVLFGIIGFILGHLL